MSIQKIITATLFGIDAKMVEVEADVSNGLPATIIVGLPDTAVQESRERVRSAIKHSGLTYPMARISLNLAPGTLPKAGTHFDLAIALSILLASKLINSHVQLNESMFIGELSLDGKVRPTAGVLAMVQKARNSGLKYVFVPEENAAMASLVKDITIFPVRTLRELIDHITNQKLIAAFLKIDTQKFSKSNSLPTIDFADIAGQDYAKRALEISASGGHNLLMTGPPGSGKTLLAKALSGILPSLHEEEILELTKIYNSAGRIHSGTINTRPVRSPHHTTSSIALIGGGAVPRPGEVTLAHHGVLFLDEFPEFSRSVLEVLRQPLEENKITISRLRHSFEFPADFILVTAMNPCPCGNYGQAKLECKCPASVVQRYQKKISGPLLDRIDLHINVARQEYKEIMSPISRESSKQVQERVEAARKLQIQRFGKIQTNNGMSVKEISTHCSLDQETSKLLETAAIQYQLSGRSIHRILKVARTIADLAKSEKIKVNHLAESLQYRLRGATAP